MLEILSREQWKIASFSSEETTTGEGFAKSLIDGDLSTFWHSRWTSHAPSFPHFVVIDLGGVHAVHKFSVAQRRILCRTVKDIDLLMSVDGDEFVLIDSYQLQDVDGFQMFDFAETKTMRFLKVVANSAWDGDMYAALAEINLYRYRSGRIRPVAGQHYAFTYQFMLF
jgi:hypothetical protein